MTHSVQCPKCKTKITNQDEIEFVEANGFCMDCEKSITMFNQENT